MNNSVTAVVVTYNRKDLLKECLDAILGQSYSVNKIILIDNASTDGTKSFLTDNGYISNPVVDYHLMNSNLGGAGGFYEGLKLAKNDPDSGWVWIMDDDTIPCQNCLENLMKANESLNTAEHSKQTDRDRLSFLASTIYGPDGEFMNVPAISNRASKNGYAYWYEFLAKGMINIKAATFVSILVSKDAINVCGLPCKDYFIWGDDFEYTQRLTNYYGDAYLVGDSVAIHKRKNAKILSIENENDANRIKMYHYFYRNEAINNMLYNGKSKIYILIKAVLVSLRQACKGKNAAKARVILKGTLEALLQYKKFENYINNQLS